MAEQLFIEERAADGASSHPYLDFFKDSIGEGSGNYYRGIGELYRASSRYQKGYGILGATYNMRQGDGLGDILSSIWRIAFPMIKTGAKKIAPALGSAALDVATHVASDALAGKNVRESAKSHLSTKGVELLKEMNKKQQKPAATAATAAASGVDATPSVNTTNNATVTIPAVSPNQPPRSNRRAIKRPVSKKTSFPTTAKSSKKGKFPALKYL